MRLHQDFIICLVWITHIEQDVFIGQAKTKRFNNTFIRLNQPICNMSHSCLERLCELVFLKSGDWKTGGIPGKNLHMWKAERREEMVDTHVICFLSARFLIRLSLPWGVCTLSWRGHIRRLSTLLLRKKLKKKKPSASCSVSYLGCFHRGGEGSSLCLSEMNSV